MIFDEIEQRNLKKIENKYRTNDKQILFQTERELNQMKLLQTELENKFFSSDLTY